ncbi:calcium-binding protein [Ramlibacter sp. PS3R-8]|uniref:calcium-binding protein n=1 Tax=Ramlibacter sp. PS3R-8 TaxID=3133437 RepID=UPI0030A5AF24
MADLIGTTGDDSITTGTSNDDSLTTSLGSDYARGTPGDDVLLMGYAWSSSYWRYGHDDFDTVDYRYVWSGVYYGPDAGLSIVVDLGVGTVQKFNGFELLGTDTVSGVDAIWGTNGNDSFVGRDHWSSEVFRGYGGNDLLDGRGGEDVADYSYATVAGIHVDLGEGIVASLAPETDTEIGRDTLREIEAVVGTSMYDEFYALSYPNDNRNSFGPGYNLFAPLAGNDLVIGNGRTIVSYDGVGGALEIDLSGQVDSGTASNIVTNFIADGDGATFDAGDITASGVSFIIAGNFNDSLVGGGRVNTLGATEGGPLNGDVSLEMFRGNGGDDYINGSTGFDRADYLQITPMVGGVEVDLAAGTVVGDSMAVGSDTLEGIESIRGTPFDDVFDARGFTLSDDASASANSGDVVATVPTGVLSSAAFNEFISVGGDDLIRGNGATRVSLDYLVEKQGGISSRIDFTTATSGSGDFGLTDGGLGRVTFSGTFSVRGGNGNDVMMGSVGMQNLQGNCGNDTLRGGDGDDSLFGQTGGDPTSFIQTSMFPDDDWLDGGAGNDLLRGDAGDDILQGGTGVDTMEGGTGNDSYFVDQATDVVSELRFGGSDIVHSAAANYTLSAHVESARITSSGAANLTGNNQANTLTGGTGANILKGGVGKDTLSGGGGADRFDYDSANHSGVKAATRDVILDFNGNDLLDLSTIDANTNVGGNNAFTFVTGAFTGAGQLRFDARTQVLYGSTDADVQAEFSIQLTGFRTLTAADIIL